MEAKYTVVDTTPSWETVERRVCADLDKKGWDSDYWKYGELEPIYAFADDLHVQEEPEEPPKQVLCAKEEILKMVRFADYRNAMLMDGETLLKEAKI